MPAVTFTSNDGLSSVEIDLPLPDSGPTVLPIAYHKAGSVLFDGILKSLCSKYGRPYVNIENILFNKGLIARNYEGAIRSSFAPSGVVYGVYRDFIDMFANAPFDNANTMILIRDPRDVIVSYYFSLRNSHFVPETGTVRDNLLAQRAAYESVTLNDSVLSRRFDHILNNMTKVARFIEAAKSRVKLYRYEDVIFDKANWIRDIAQNIAVNLDEAFLAKLLERFDVVPSSEDASQHIRRVTPGDYQEKMTGESLTYLQEKHRELFDLLGYPLDQIAA